MLQLAGLGYVGDGLQWSSPGVSPFGWVVMASGVALTFEKLHIANAQHGKNCVSSPATKATISTDLPKIDKHEDTNV